MFPVVVTTIKPGLIPLKEKDGSALNRKPDKQDGEPVNNKL